MEMVEVGGGRTGDLIVLAMGVTDKLHRVTYDAIEIIGELLRGLHALSTSSRAADIVRILRLLVVKFLHNLFSDVHRGVPGAPCLKVMVSACLSPTVHLVLTQSTTASFEFKVQVPSNEEPLWPALSPMAAKPSPDTYCMST